MGVSSGRSRVADLAFQVLGRTIHPDWFSAREHQRVAGEGWDADIRIIEGGHAILFRKGFARLSEVLSGPETSLPETARLFQSPIRHERTANLEVDGGLSYQTCFEVERVDSEVFAHLCEEMTLDASRGRLFHRFSPVNRMAPPPISHIRIETCIGGLSVHTFHTFPEERAILRTQSLFERRNLHSPR